MYCFTTTAKTTQRFQLFSIFTVSNYTIKEVKMNSNLLHENYNVVDLDAGHSAKGAGKKKKNING